MELRLHQIDEILQSGRKLQAEAPGANAYYQYTLLTYQIVWLDETFAIVCFAGHQQRVIVSLLFVCFSIHVYQSYAMRSLDPSGCIKLLNRGCYAIPIIGVRHPVRFCLYIKWSIAHSDTERSHA